MPLDKILSPEMAKLLGVEVGEEIPKSQVTVLAYVKSHNLFGPGEKDFTLDDMLEPLFGPQTRQPVARVWDHHQTSQSIGIPTTEMEEGSLGAVLENLDTVEYGRSGRRRPRRSPSGNRPSSLQMWTMQLSCSVVVVASEVVTDIVSTATGFPKVLAGCCNNWRGFLCSDQLLGAGERGGMI